MKNLPKGERPRERLLRHGKETLANPELLAILLRTGTREKSALSLAQEVLSLHEDGIRYLEECTPEELAQVKGVGIAKSCQILAAMELGKRIATLPRKKRVEIKKPAEIAQLFMEKMRYYRKEHFKALLLNAKGEIIEDVEISIGDLCSTLIHPREVFNKALKRSAASVILVHNHPSGNPTPSKEDIETTKRLVMAAEILGINLLDHIVIGDGEYISLKQQGLM